jgi:hypothetical protein
MASGSLLSSESVRMNKERLAAGRHLSPDLSHLSPDGGGIIPVPSTDFSTANAQLLRNRQLLVR